MSHTITVYFLNSEFKNKMKIYWIYRFFGVLESHSKVTVKDLLSSS